MLQALQLLGDVLEQQYGVSIRWASSGMAVIVDDTGCRTPRPPPASIVPTRDLAAQQLVQACAAAAG